MKIKINSGPLPTDWRSLPIGQLFEDQTGAIWMVIGHASHSNELVHWGGSGPFLGQLGDIDILVTKLLSISEVTFHD